MSLSRRAALTLTILPLLGGCTTAGQFAGAVTGALAATTSANPAIGYAAGIGTKAATDAVMKYLSRKRHQGEQDEIARAVGPLAVGQTAPWEIKHQIPLFDDARGSVTVTRAIDNVLTPCKEAVFTVAVAKPDAPRQAYVATACQAGGLWKWAGAEPATTRWGVLQ